MDLWKPYTELLSGLDIKQEDGKVSAYCFDKLIGVLDAADAKPVVLNAWKKELTTLLAKNSSTCILQTRCGCSRWIDLDSRRMLHQYLVPLPARISIEATIDDHFETHSREFRFTGKYQGGFKVMEEK